MTEYKILEENDTMLNIEKDLIELQKTIIFFANKILFELEQVMILLKERPIEIDKLKILEKEFKDPIKIHLDNLKIPYGYGGNNLTW